MREGWWLLESLSWKQALGNALHEEGSAAR